VLLLHENAESLPQLAAALSERVELEAVRVANPAWYARARLRRDAGFAWAEYRGERWQRLVPVPGLRRFPGASEWLLRRILRGAVRRFEPDVVLVDTPYLGPMLEAVPTPVGYLAADAYQYYGWDRRRTMELEDALLERSAVVFAVSHRLAEDFRKRGASRVVQLGTAVSRRFVAACREAAAVPEAGSAPTAPAELAAIAGPRVGVVGMINRTYDWGLIEALAGARPGVSFVFVGPIQEEIGAERRHIERVLGLGNVHWLGGRAHAELPRYLGGCEVLFNPLRADAHADRRFPLRLCEYAATDRPVLSTAIHELPWFPADFVAIESREVAGERLDEALGLVGRIDVEGRGRWIEGNTWDARAEQVVEVLEGVLAGEG
jgi:glycosyltransferase involved in cell wall biosynthesis